MIRPPSEPGQPSFPREEPSSLEVLVRRLRRMLRESSTRVFPDALPTCPTDEQLTQAARSVTQREKGSVDALAGLLLAAEREGGEDLRQTDETLLEQANARWWPA